MVEFVTLLLGLISGPHVVELSAEPHVAAIHLKLDGETVEVLDTGPPWRTTLDIGSDLRPRRLEAVAFNRAGGETGRAQQILNYTRPSHEIGLTLDPARADGGRTGRVVWRAVLDQAPERADLRFDGQPIAVAADGSFPLPPYDLGVPHVIEATAVFPDGVESRAELALGGGLGEQVTSALSPLALRSKRGRPWAAGKAAGWIEHQGRPVEVFATRAAPRRLVLVRDTSINRGIGYYSAQLDRMKYDIPWRGEIDDTYLTLVSPVPIDRHGGAFQVDDVPLTLTRREEMRRLLSSHFTVHPADNADDARVRQKLWAALAVAGKRAAASQGTRAVFLMVDEDLDPGSAGQDQPSLRVALDYLASLRVPVFIWGPNDEALEALGLDGEERAYDGLRGLMRVMEHIDVELDSQTLVLVEGDFLPHEVELAEDVPKRVDWVR